MVFPEPNQSNTEEETTDVSLITGALRACSTSSSEIINGTSESSSLVPRNQTLTVANTNTAGIESEAMLNSSCGSNSATFLRKSLIYANTEYDPDLFVLQHHFWLAVVGRGWSPIWGRRQW